MIHSKILEKARRITKESINNLSKERDIKLQESHKEDCRLMKTLTRKYYNTILSQIFKNANSGLNHARIYICYDDLISKYDLGTPKDIAERWIKNLTLQSRNYSNNEYINELLGLKDQDMLYGFYVKSIVPYSKRVWITITWL
tara:strand:- start:1 stop:429 length:429 start_codon:yes stop_codon:yes gene_type:complete